MGNKLKKELIKRLVLGDDHGHIDHVKHAYEREQPDEVIILGDYFDSFVIKPEQQLECWETLLTMKYKHERDYGYNTFIMLMGNHDFHYAFNIERYSGWNKDTANLAHESIIDQINNYNNLNIVHLDKTNKTIYSHAGVSMSWLKERCNYCKLNEINHLSINYLRFTYRDGGNSFGSSKYNSPIWIRPGNLMTDMYVDNTGEIWTQIVGHTHTHSIECYEAYDEQMKLWTIDCLQNQYVVEYMNGINKKLIERRIVNVNDKPSYSLQ